MKNLFFIFATVIIFATSSCHKEEVRCHKCEQNQQQDTVIINNTYSDTTIVNNNDTSVNTGGGGNTTGANIVLSAMMPGAGMQDGDTLWVLTSDPGVRLANGTINTGAVSCNPIWAVVSTASGFPQYRSLGINYYQLTGTMAIIPAQATGVKNTIFDYMRPGTSNFIGLIISN